MNSECLTIIGLALNFIGALMLAFSYSAGKKVGHQVDDPKNAPDKKRDFVLPNFNKHLFIFGVAILALGFLIQIISTIVY